MNAQPRRAAHRKPRSVTHRGGSTLTVAGLALGLWLGMTAPSISPVAASSPSGGSLTQIAATSATLHVTALSGR